MIHIHSKDSNSQLTQYDLSDIQPNAIDVRLDLVFALEKRPFVLDETKKIHRGSRIVQPNAEGYYKLKPGSYEVIMKGEVVVGEGEAGFIITRSTLNRNGLFLTSGLYDSGYHGVMAGVLHVNGGPAAIQKGTRIGQFLLFKAETLHKYDGDYGKGKHHDKKYNKSN